MTFSPLIVRSKEVLSWVLWVAWLGSWASGPFARAGESDLKPETLRVVFREESFMGVNANDAAAAFKMLAQTVGRRRGYDVVPEVSILGSDEAFVAALRTEAFDLAVVDPWVYLRYGLDAVVRADFVAEEAGGIAKRFLVLVRNDAGVTDLAGLRGKSLMVMNQAHADLGRRWLVSQVREAGWDAPESFFGMMESVGKPSGVVLPVFFAKREAALVDEGSFRVMVEMNPQVGRVLSPVRTSEPLSNVLVGTRSSAWKSEEFRSSLLASMAELDQHVAGRQVLTLFKIKALKAPPSHQMDTVRALVEGRPKEAGAEGGRGAMP